MKRLACTLCTLLFFCVPGWTKEGGDQYPNGAENWYAGELPPGGSYYINYLGYYTARLKAGNGRDAFLSGGTPSANATFDALRFAYISRLRVLGSSYGVHAILPVVHQSIDMAGRASNTDVGDLIVNPIILGWHGSTWNAVTGLDIFVPTGYFNKNDPRVSIGANYWGFDPLVAVTCTPKGSWELSGKFMYNLKTIDNATRYLSGQEFHTDFAAGKHMGNFMLGVTGYGLKQTTDDRLDGQVVPASSGLWDAGRRGQVLAIGPSIGYTSHRHDIVMLDWQHESFVRNRFGGDKFWIKAIIPLGTLFKRGATL